MSSKPTLIKVRSFAKLNLTFEILGTLPNGYHQIRTFFQSIDLFDELNFELRQRNDNVGVDEGLRVSIALEPERGSELAPGPEPEPGLGLGPGPRVRA